MVDEYLQTLLRTANSKAVVVAGFDDCIIGLDLGGKHIIYSLDKMIDKVSRTEDCNFGEAVCWFHENKDIYQEHPYAPIYLNFPVTQKRLPPKSPKSKHIGALYVCL